jgi:hypothetical protein
VTIGAPGPLPSYDAVTNASTPAIPPPHPGEGDLVEVFITNAVKTSAGPGPGMRSLPRSEASALVNARMAVWGGPPRGYNLEA